MARNPDTSVDIEAAFEQGTLIDEAMNEAVQEAILRHRQANLPLVTWRDGRIVEIPAESIGDATEPSSQDDPDREG